VVDSAFAEPSLAGLYDLFCGWEPSGDSGFYLPLVMAADSVLDVGCGTGMLLRRAREAGHAGRLTGLDPAAAMLDVARRCGRGIEGRGIEGPGIEGPGIEGPGIEGPGIEGPGIEGPGIEWVLGDLSSTRWDREFELVVMTGHAFQVLTGDEQLHEALAAVRAALLPGGRFAFETRNPVVREWEEWVPANAVLVTDSAGAVVRMAHQVELPVQGDLVSFTTTYSSPDWERPRYSSSTLRFLDASALSLSLAGAGLEIEQQYGDWDGAPLGAGSPEIITVARRVALPLCRNSTQPAMSNLSGSWSAPPGPT
jgi:SAM-dependent methyltransferase